VREVLGRPRVEGSPAPRVMITEEHLRRATEDLRQSSLYAGRGRPIN